MNMQKGASPQDSIHHQMVSESWNFTDRVQMGALREKWKKNIFWLSGLGVKGHYMGCVNCSNPGFPVWVSDWVHNKTWIFSISQQETRAFLALQTAKINIAMAKRLKRLFLTSPTTSVWVPSYFICQEGEGKRLPGRMLRLRREEGDFSLS